MLASGFTSHASFTARVIDAWRAGHYTLIISDGILSELERTFAAPHFSRCLSTEEMVANYDLLHRQAVVVTPTVAVSGIASHPEDDLALAAAVSAQADYLVTGDSGLHRLGRYQGIAIVSPREFLDLLAKESPV